MEPTLTIERTIGLVLDSSTILDRLFLKQCALINNAAGTTYDGPCPNLITGKKASPNHPPPPPDCDSFSPWTRTCFQVARAHPTLADITRYFWFTICIPLYVCILNVHYLSAWVCCWYLVPMRMIIYKFYNVCPFHYMAVTWSRRIRSVNRLTTQVHWW